MVHTVLPSVLVTGEKDQTPSEFWNSPVTYSGVVLSILGFYCKKLNPSQFSDLKTDITITFLRILFSLINQHS